MQLSLIHILYSLISGGVIETDAAYPEKAVVKADADGSLKVPANAMAGSVFVYKMCIRDRVKVFRMNTFPGGSRSTCDQTVTAPNHSKFMHNGPDAR